MVIVVVTHVKSIVAIVVVFVLLICDSLSMITFSCFRYCQIICAVVVVVVRHSLISHNSLFVMEDACCPS